MRAIRIAVLAAALASPSPGTILHTLVGPIDNSDGRPGDFDYYSFDLRIAIIPGDDWTATEILARIEPGLGAAFYPRLERLKPPPVRGEPPSSWESRWGCMYSSPRDWPNTLDNSGSTVAAVAIESSDAKLGGVWFDTSRDDGAHFAAFRLTIRQPRGDFALTLTPTGESVATLRGVSHSVVYRGFRVPYEFRIYRVPEPGTLGLLGLFAAAGFGRIRGGPRAGTPRPDQPPACGSPAPVTLSRGRSRARRLTVRPGRRPRPGDSAAGECMAFR